VDPHFTHDGFATGPGPNCAGSAIACAWVSKSRAKGSTSTSRRSGVRLAAQATPPD